MDNNLASGAFVAEGLADATEEEMLDCLEYHGDDGDMVAVAVIPRRDAIEVSLLGVSRAFRASTVTLQGTTRLGDSWSGRFVVPADLRYVPVEAVIENCVLFRATDSGSPSSSQK